MAYRWIRQAMDGNSLKPYLIGLFLVTGTVAAYWPVKFADFIHFDDFVYIVQNPDVLDGLTKKSLLWAFTKSHWHPVTWLSHMLDVELFGIMPGGHHITNLLLHIVNSLLLYFALWRLTGDVGLSGLVAALFALHPIQVESVAWVAQRKTLLCGLFSMLCLWSYGVFVKRSTQVWFLWVILFFILGLMSKWMIVTLPFVLLLTDYWPLGRLTGVDGSKAVNIGGEVWCRIKEKIPLFVLSAFGCIVAYFGQKSIYAVRSLDEFPFALRLSNAVVSYMNYIGKAVWPHRLAVFYPYPQSIPFLKTGAAVLLLSVITYFAFKTAKRYPYFLVGWLWFLGANNP